MTKVYSLSFIFEFIISCSIFCGSKLVNTFATKDLKKDVLDIKILFILYILSKGTFY